MCPIINAHAAHDFVLQHLHDHHHTLCADAVDLLVRLVHRFAADVLAALDMEEAS